MNRLFFLVQKRYILMSIKDETIFIYVIDLIIYRIIVSYYLLIYQIIYIYNIYIYIYIYI